MKTLLLVMASSALIPLGSHTQADVLVEEITQKEIKCAKARDINEKIYAVAYESIATKETYQMAIAAIKIVDQQTKCSTGDSSIANLEAGISRFIALSTQQPTPKKTGPKINVELLPNRNDSNKSAR